MVPEACELIYSDIFGIDREAVVLFLSHYSIIPQEVEIFMLPSYCFHLSSKFFSTKRELFVLNFFMYV